VSDVGGLVGLLVVGFGVGARVGTTQSNPGALLIQVSFIISVHVSVPSSHS